MIARLFTVVGVIFLVTTVNADDYTDDFSSKQDDARKALRGDWKFEKNQASCVADPELYKKYNNHGPILRWNKDFTDGDVQLEMKASDCQRLVFTLNGDGHVFRVSMIDTSKPANPNAKRKPTSRLIAWATKSSKTNKGDSFKPEGLPGVNDLNDKWVTLHLKVKGEQADLTIGEFKTQLKHPALARKKSEVTISFAEGQLAVKNFRLQTP